MNMQEDEVCQSEDEGENGLAVAGDSEDTVSMGSDGKLTRK